MPMLNTVRQRKSAGSSGTDVTSSTLSQGYTVVRESMEDSTIWFGAASPFDRDVFVTGSGTGELRVHKYKYVCAMVPACAASASVYVPRNAEECSWNPRFRDRVLRMFSHIGFDRLFRTLLLRNANQITYN
jgi:hypothetical protein